MQKLKILFNLDTLIFLAVEILLGWVLFRMIIGEKNFLTLLSIITILSLIYMFYLFFKEKLKRNAKIYHQKNIYKHIERYPLRETIEERLEIEYPSLDEAQKNELFKHLRSFFLAQVEIYSPYQQYSRDNKEKNQEEKRSQKEIEAIEALRSMLNEMRQNTPSVLLNRAWEIFSETEEYLPFCEQSFGTLLPFEKLMEAEERGAIVIPNKQQNFIKLWTDLCFQEEIDPCFPQSLPSMFSIDKRFSIKGGRVFELNREKLPKEVGLNHAPTPAYLSYEIEEEGERAYLTEKLYHYLTHMEYVGVYQEWEFEELFKTIDKDQKLKDLLYKNEDITLFQKWVLEHTAPPPPPMK